MESKTRPEEVDDEIAFRNVEKLIEAAEMEEALSTKEKHECIRAYIIDDLLTKSDNNYEDIKESEISYKYRSPQHEETK
jgi:hypothetical protein